LLLTRLKGLWARPYEPGNICNRTKFNDEILMRLYALLILGCLMLPGYAMAVGEKIIYGYVEKVTLMDKKLTLSAKLDTGAKTASLGAINIHQVIIKGIIYLTFTVPSKQGDIQFISKYLGKVKIKMRIGENNNLKHSAIKRPVVLMCLKIGTIERYIPVNLTNRKRFIYPLLLGRDAIKAFDGLVDPSATFTVKTDKNEVS
jgi:hypothetical protein